MQTMDAALAGLVRAGKITQRARRVALLDARGAAPPAGRRRRAARPDRMATYVFKAMDLTGAKATGEVEADDQAGRRRPAEGARPDRPRHQGQARLEGDHRSTSCKRIKPTDLTIMTRQLATMISSGMTILRALYVLEAQTENKLLTEIIADVRKDVEAGLPLSDALERHPKVFTPLFVAMTARRRDRRRARGVAAARRRPAREGGLAAPPGQVRRWSTRRSS